MKSKVNTADPILTRRVRLSHRAGLIRQRILKTLIVEKIARECPGPKRRITNRNGDIALFQEPFEGLEIRFYTDAFGDVEKK